MTSSLLQAHRGQPAQLAVEPIVRGRYLRYGKRAIDLAVSLAFLIMALPLLIGIALLVRLSLGPSVLFRQERIGKHGVPFVCLKFRTMRPDRRASDPRAVTVERRQTHKSSDDPRHTRLGLFLRRFSLDELPQLWNVLRGDMSLVGPRPEQACLADAEFKRHPRHDVRPGITGPFQTSPLRGSGCLTEGLELDEGYVRHITAASDARIMVRTVSAVVGGSGG